MPINAYKNWMFIGFLITAVIFLGHFLLPDRRVVLHPASDALYEIYGAPDAERGSSAQWLDQDNHVWACHYKQHHEYGCGWDIYWDHSFTSGLDFSRFEALEVDVDYEGTASRIRIYLRNYNSEYATPNNIHSTKFMAMTFPVEEANGPVRIDMNEFSVANWWLQEQNIRRQWSQPELDNIAKIGVDFIEAGKHQVRVNSITLLGEWIKTTTLLFVILGLWMAFFLLEGLVRFYHLYKKAQHERKVITALQDRQSSLEREKTTLKALADIDPLTGIYNRTGMEGYIAEAFGTEGAHGDLGVLLIDIDHFKQLNDTHGHNMGDKVLKAFAAAMSANLRENDVFARWGGEEFVIICPNKNPLALRHFADKLRAIAAQYIFGGDLELHITISIGISIAQSGDSFEQALKRADRALYRAKHGGRNRVEYEL